MRARISPASRRCTASGLIRISERSTAKAAEVYSGRGLLSGAPATARRPHLERRELDGGRLDRCLAVRADLPERLERRLAVGAGLFQLRRAHRTDEEIRGHLGAADWAVEVAAREALLHRLDLELPLADVLEILRRAEEHVD